MFLPSESETAMELLGVGRAMEHLLDSFFHLYKVIITIVTITIVIITIMIITIMFQLFLRNTKYIKKKPAQKTRSGSQFT